MLPPGICSKKPATLSTVSRVRWDRRVACMENMKMHIILSRQRRTDQLADGNCRLEDNGKVSRKKTQDMRVWTGFKLLRIGGGEGHD